MATEPNKPILQLPPAPAGVSPEVTKWLEEVLRRIREYVQAKINQIP